MTLIIYSGVRAADADTCQQDAWQFTAIAVSDWPTKGQHMQDLQKEQKCKTISLATPAKFGSNPHSNIIASVAKDLR